jgi:hypothetical protein
MKTPWYVINTPIYTAVTVFKSNERLFYFDLRASPVFRRGLG